MADRSLLMADPDYLRHDALPHYYFGVSPYISSMSGRSVK